MMTAEKKVAMVVKIVTKIEDGTETLATAEAAATVAIDSMTVRKRVTAVSVPSAASALTATDAIAMIAAATTTTEIAVQVTNAGAKKAPTPAHLAIGTTAGTADRAATGGTIGDRIALTVAHETTGIIVATDLAPTIRSIVAMTSIVTTGPTAITTSVVAAMTAATEITDQYGARTMIASPPPIRTISDLATLT